MKSIGLQNSQFRDFLLNWKIFGSATQAYIKKKQQIFIFFKDWEKLRSSTRAIFKNPELSLSNKKILEVQPKSDTQKTPILNLWMNWENFCCNVSFTVENKIRYFTQNKPANISN